MEGMLECDGQGSTHFLQRVAQVWMQRAIAEGGLVEHRQCRLRIISTFLRASQCTHSLPQVTQHNPNHLATFLFKILAPNPPLKGKPPIHKLLPHNPRHVPIPLRILHIRDEIHNAREIYADAHWHPEPCVA
jgi:hypothetical protein